MQLDRSQWIKSRFDSITKGLAYNLELNQHSFGQLSQIRYGLERGLVDEVLRVITAQTLRRLEDAVSGMEEAARAGDNTTYSEHDFLFHSLLFSDLQNPLIDKLMDIFWRLYELLYPTRLGKAALLDAREHRRILEAIEAGDASLTRQRMGESGRGVSTCEPSAEVAE